MTLHLISLMSAEPQTSQTPPASIEIQREIERRRRVCQRADGNPVDPRFGDRAYRVGSHSARRLGYSASIDQLHRFTESDELHVVEHDDVRTRVDRRTNLIERVALYLHLDPGRRDRPRTRYRECDVAI